VSGECLDALKSKFKITSWYKRAKNGKTRLYYAAYSADGLHWTEYPEPILLGCDTITLAQDPRTGEYLAFHKREGDPRVTGRQIFLATSRDMENWTEPEPVMVADEIDNQAAKLLKGGVNSQFYNMSAFPYAGQWLGLVAHFRHTGRPAPVLGRWQSSSDGIIDIQLVHSRDGRKWERCSDRNPVIPTGPHAYDAGCVMGVNNTPVFVNDEIWMYYTAVTTTHGADLPAKKLSIARAAWRLDGWVSLRYPETRQGLVETKPFVVNGGGLSVNANMENGRLMVEVLDGQTGEVLEGYEKSRNVIKGVDSIRCGISWNGQSALPAGIPICLRFLGENGDLYSYTIE
jgi:hypothetical protein